jgi:hypothetical protein
LVHPVEEELLDQPGQLLCGVTVTDRRSTTQMYTEVLNESSIGMIQLGTYVYRDHSNVTKFTTTYLESVYHIDGSSHMTRSDDKYNFDIH